MTYTSPTTLDDVFRACKTPLSGEGRRFITSAYEVARDAHAGQKRKSGEEYITHCLGTATILASMDPRTIAAGLLHDVPEDTDVTLETIEKKFGPDVSHIVDGITKLSKIRLQGQREEYFLENLRKMFLAMASDIRVVIVKLADRLHNMRTLGHLPPEKQHRIALETMEIFAPIANRLGINEIKGELEDLAFQYLEPEHHTLTRELLEDITRTNHDYIDHAIQTFRTELKEENITTLDLHGRIKNVYRLYQKLKRHDMNINRVYDLFAIRVIVPRIADCYEALGIIHKRHRPMIGRIKDYISLPKPNGYQSLHTTVFGPEGRILEVQIRTQKMHDEAEFGIAAHWLYTERERSGWTNFLFRRKHAPQDMRTHLGQTTPGLAT
jgi:GTP pyrophosphokinase